MPSSGQKGIFTEFFLFNNCSVLTDSLPVIVMTQRLCHNVLTKNL